MQDHVRQASQDCMHLTLGQDLWLNKGMIEHPNNLTNEWMNDLMNG